MDALTDRFLKIIAMTIVAGLLATTGIWKGIRGGDIDNAPEGAIHYVHNDKEGFALTLYEDGLFIELKGKEYDVPIEDISNVSRSFSTLRIDQKSGQSFEFTFLLLLEAKQFEEQIKGLLRN